MKKISLLILMLVTLFQFACASSQQKKAHEFMSEALNCNARGDIYLAVKNALKALSYDNQNQEAKKFITANYNRALEQKIYTINKISVNTSGLRQFRDELADLKYTQNNLVTFIQFDLFDINAIKTNYEGKLSQVILDELDVLLKQGEADKARHWIDEYKAVGLPLNEQFISLINRLQLVYLSQKRYVDLLDFVRRNRDFTQENNLKVIYQESLHFAANDENTNKRRALEIYEFLMGLKNDEDIRNKINKLKNELITMVAILDIENQTDEFIQVDNKEFIDRVKRGLDDNKKLIEVVLKDGGMNECYP